MSNIKEKAKELCTCHHKCKDTKDCVVEDEALLLINENKSNNFDVKSNEELFKQALVEGVNRHIDKTIEQAKQIEKMARDICHLNVSCEECTMLAKQIGQSKNQYCKAMQYAKRAYNAGYRKIPDNIGEFSDGYHTFNELYHHRAVLFSVICNMFSEKAWKSKLHDTGDMYDGMFIVGIETEQGQATYHYDIEPYWDMFKVKELEKAPKWDGHSPTDAIQRIGNIETAGYRKQSENVIELPCKVGDKIFFIHHINDIIPDFISDDTVTKIGVTTRGILHEVGVDIADFGKTVFLTKEEAENALAKMKGGEE